MKQKSYEPVKVCLSKKSALEAALDEMAIIDHEANEGLSDEGLFFGVEPCINRCRVDGLEHVTRRYFDLNFGERLDKKEEVRLYKANVCVYLALIVITKLQLSKTPNFNQIYSIRHNLEKALGLVNELLMNMQVNKNAAKSFRRR